MSQMTAVIRMKHSAFTPPHSICEATDLYCSYRLIKAWTALGGRRQYQTLSRNDAYSIIFGIVLDLAVSFIPGHGQIP